MSLSETQPSYGHFVGGDEVPSAEQFLALDPSVGRPWATVAEASETLVDSAVQAARRAYRAWRQTSLEERQRVLLGIADEIERADWPELLATENGRPIREAAGADVPTAAGVFRYYAGLVRGMHGRTLEGPSRTSRVFTVREPMGVIAALIPWNSPLISTALKVAPALAAGNSVVLKPSEFASPSVIELARRTAHLVPAGVLNVVTGTGPLAGAALVAHPDIAKISFTGGTATARHIVAATAKTLTPTILELGGKSAFIVCPDADLDAAVHDAVTGILSQNGEVCFAASRLFVHESIRDEFLERMTNIVQDVRVGNALDYATQVGPLISDAHRGRVLGYVDLARREGATLLAGNDQPSQTSEGYYMRPAIIDDPSGRTTAAHEEIFGPVVVVQSWEHELDVLERANSSPYGLAAGVWTKDLGRAHRFAEALEAGTVWVNTWFQVPPGQPLGGVKQSGYGRELCAETLDEYSTQKAVSVRFDVERPDLWSGVDAGATSTNGGQATSPESTKERTI